MLKDLKENNKPMKQQSKHFNDSFTKKQNKNPWKSKKNVNLKITVEIKGWIGRKSEDLKEIRTKGTQWVKVPTTQAQ